MGISNVRPDPNTSTQVYFLVISSVRQLPRDQHRVGLDVTVPMVFPFAAQGVVAVRWFKHWIVRQCIHDGKPVNIAGRGRLQGCAVEGGQTGLWSGITTGHSTRLTKDVSLVAGYAHAVLCCTWKCECRGRMDAQERLLHMEVRMSRAHGCAGAIIRVGE